MSLPSVVIITPGTFPIPSGSSSSVERVVEYMANLAASRVNIRIFGKRFVGQEYEEQIREVSCTRVDAENSSVYMKQVLEQLKQLNPDIIQVENRPRSVLSIRKARPTARIWLNLHSTTFMSKRQLSRRVLRRALCESERIFVNSRYLYNQVRKVAPECKHRIVVNPLGVDHQRFVSRWSEGGQAQYNEWRRMQGWEDRQLILFAGRLIPLKGVHHLLSAVPQVIQAYPKALFLIIGGATYGKYHKTNYIRRLERIGRRYPKHVIFLSYVPHEDMPLWYGAADLVVVPSVERESFGLVNVEAMASGAPVIATRVGGIQEVVQHQITGLLIKPKAIGSQLVRVLCYMLGNLKMCERMGKAGAELTASAFTWEGMAQRWVDEIYRCSRDR